MHNCRVCFKSCKSHTDKDLYRCYLEIHIIDTLDEKPNKDKGKVK